MEQKWTEKQRAHETQDMEYKAMKFAEYSKGPKLVNTSDNDLRDHMIAFRKTETEKKSNREIVDAIQKYFDKNYTMDGEKDLKTVAGQFARYFENVPDNDQIMDSCRDKMIDQYSQICIREFYVKDVANMEGVKNHYSSAITHTEDGKDKLLINSQINREKYEVDGISHYRIHVSTLVNNGDGPTIENIGELRAHEHGVGQHSLAMDGMMASTLIIDNTGGKMKNLTVRTFVDLGQEMEGSAPKVELDNSRTDPEISNGSGVPDDDFTNAVNAISMDEGNTLSC